MKAIQAWATVGVLTLGIGMCSLRDVKLKQEGAARVVESVAKQTEKTNAKARAARAAARVDDAVKRVRDAYCRDCN